MDYYRYINTKLSLANFQSDLLGVSRYARLQYG